MELRPLACWDFVFESCGGQGYLSFVNVVLSGRGLCVGPMTCPGGSYRVLCVWVWSWNLDNEEVLRHGDKSRKKTRNNQLGQGFHVRSHNLHGASMSFVMSVLPFACLPAYISTDHTGQIFVIFDVGEFYENLFRNSKLVRVEQKYHPLYIKT
jgi:hypothetical protein